VAAGLWIAQRRYYQTGDEMKSGIGFNSCLVGVAFGSVFATAIALLFFHVIMPNITPPPSVAVTATETLSLTVTVHTNRRITAVGTMHIQDNAWQQNIYCHNQTENKPCVIPRPVGQWLLLVHDGTEWHRLVPHNGEIINATYGWHQPSGTDKIFIEQ
jgi:hypothetical protein